MQLGYGNSVKLMLTCVRNSV